MILMPESGSAVVKSQGHLGNAGLESSASSGGIPEVSLLIEERVVAIHDMRAEADTLSIDRQGFELLRHATSVDDLYDDTAVQSVYERELETFLIEATGADRVQIFDYTRRSDYGEGAPNPEGQRGPAGRVHVDYTVASGPIRAADTLGADEVERILRTGGRIAQVNVWRADRRSCAELAARTRGREKCRRVRAGGHPAGVPRPDRRDLPDRSRAGAEVVLGARDGARRGSPDQGVGQPPGRARAVHSSRVVHPSPISPWLRHERASRHAPTLYSKG